MVTFNSCMLGVMERPKPEVTIKPAQHVFRGETVTLRCDIYGEGVTSWSYSWYKEGSTSVFSDRQEHTFSSVNESDGGKYSCNGSETEGSRWSQMSDAVTLTVSGKVRNKGNRSVESLYSPSDMEQVIADNEFLDRGKWSQGFSYTYSDCHCTERPKAKVTIKPAQHVFRGETVTLRCDIYDEGVTSWRYSWYKEGSTSVFSDRQEHTFSSVTESDAGKYSCKGSETEGSRWSQMSDAVTLTVSDHRAVLSLSSQKWLTEGDPVTLICEVYNFSTGWTFSWFTLTVSADNSRHYNLLSDSSRGAGGNYTVSSAALNHTGVYSCRAEREKSAYKTQYSNTQLLWVTGVSPPVSLIVSPSRTQHFTFVSLSLRCEDQSNSTGWRVRRYTDDGWLDDCSSLRRGSQTGSTCTISSTITSDTGVYWCESESGEKHHLSHEGFYYCKHPERGESPKSWISVRDSRSDGLKPIITGVTAGLTVTVLIIVFLILLWRYRNNKGGRSQSPSTVSQQQNNSQTSDQKHSEAGYNTLQSDSVSEPTELTYAEIELKSTKKQMKKKENKENKTESSDCFYSKLTLKTDQGAGSSDVTYAQTKRLQSLDKTASCLRLKGFRSQEKRWHVSGLLQLDIRRNGLRLKGIRRSEEESPLLSICLNYSGHGIHQSCKGCCWDPLQILYNDIMSCWMLDTWCFSTFRLRMPHRCSTGFRSDHLHLHLP
ncbi:Fc receptor-like protein 5 [Labeo rohita]|uniref:Fc receptor-like protein 5 n=1 Tax=Labeo rohita TaxID=84645 RepID=A0ABQ8L5K6_LABRO|nr:Fc receptor-like protein 5 [Labeo rohita]